MEGVRTGRQHNDFPPHYVIRRKQVDKHGVHILSESSLSTLALNEYGIDDLKCALFPRPVYAPRSMPVPHHTQTCQDMYFGRAM